mmetsp:Transcript_21920/g.30127  ORF Transcript_21920/g.30127 Transcript_21920/m.30127 type:complete len:376 (+) Transcript_21920:32-1159(+)|eukprot:CAMPEP_0170077552 /NCGR_PEP_ID=MMETSP0019_2-20121128/14338_1 /TAXON_ID=98059 /ORGANISM="Dinobryon sp., Strain UTEXLB2267" /LENGTH=375 /DNA_ID=CAMNT_0010289933 /DNA_START=57 /DNA_END=1184 /DNA_ORIENTATION=-
MAKFVDADELKNFVITLKKACDLLQPLVSSFYSAINSVDASNSSKLKADKSFFSIADGLVQYMLVNFLLGGNKFAAIVGEEDSNVQILPPAEFYKVDDLVIPPEFYPLVDSTSQSILNLAKDIHPDAFKNCTIFIDPIDGTREFCTALGEQCSICIGVADGEGKSIAGIVYRPITQPPTYALGTLSESGNHYCESQLQSLPLPVRGLLASNGSISPFVRELLAALHCDRVSSGGAGNKMLMLLEGKGHCYIQDRGVSRWDTCAAEAVLKANGGILAKLSTFANSKELESYHYLQSDKNLDFVDKQASLTPYNASAAAKNKGLAAGAVDLTVEDFNPYSNLCGLFAVGKADANSEALDIFFAAIQTSATVAAPAYD